MSSGPDVALQECQQRAVDFNAQRRAESELANYARARSIDRLPDLTLRTDRISELLDELADLAEVWRRRRMAGQETGSTRVALLNAAAAVTDLQKNEASEKWQRAHQP